MKRLTKAERRRIAVHEAGHAIAALKLGRQVAEVRIREEASAGEPAGHIATGSYVSRLYMYDRQRGAYTREAAVRTQADRDVIVDYAGAQAEIILLRGYYPATHAIDLANAKAALVAAYGEQADLHKIEARLKRRALNLLIRFLPELGMIAAELFSRGALSESEIREIIKPGQPMPPSFDDFMGELHKDRESAT